MENTKTRRNKYYKIATSIFVCFILLCVGLTAFFTVHRAVTPLDEKQQETLKAKEEILTSDFSNIYVMENVSCTLQDSNWSVVIYEEECQMDILYDMEYNLISKEIVDNRLTAFQIFVIAAVVSFLTGIMLYFYLFIGFPRLLRIDEQRK